MRLLLFALMMCAASAASAQSMNCPGTFSATSLNGVVLFQCAGQNPISCSQGFSAVSVNGNSGIQCTGAPQPPAQASAAGLTTLKFDDEMTSSNINPAGNGQWYNGLWYAVPAPLSDFVFASHGLTISAPAGANVDSSLATLNKNTSFTGSFVVQGPFYAETNMIWDGTLNNWAAFWFFAAEHAQGTDGGHWCELDAFESFPDASGPHFVGTEHEWLNGGTSQNANANNFQSPPYDSTQPHIYGVLMTSSQVTWYFDNVAIMSWPTYAVCLTQHLFMVLGQQYHSADPNTSTVQLTDRWVRVWQAQ